jgi:uncharacterized protein YndB with AHSA1/START domain
VIRLVLRLAVVGAVIGWLLDRLLAARAGGAPPEPIRTEIWIDAPIERVWEVLADVEAQPRWMLDLKSVRMLTPPPIGVGTRAEGDIRIFGMAVVDPITITAFEPPRRFAIRHVGRFSGEGLIELEPAPDGSSTVVRWSETLIPPFLPHLAGLGMAPNLQRVFERDLENLREFIETGLAES